MRRVVGVAWEITHLSYVVTWNKVKVNKYNIPSSNSEGIGNSTRLGWVHLSSRSSSQVSRRLKCPNVFCDYPRICWPHYSLVQDGLTNSHDSTLGFNHYTWKRQTWLILKAPRKIVANVILIFFRFSEKIRLDFSYDVNLFLADHSYEMSNKKKKIRILSTAFVKD